MRELLLLSLGGIKYGVWKDEILAVRGIETLHRLPLSPTCIAGMSILDDRTITLADLSVCIGLSPITRRGKNRILVLSEEEKVPGFIVDGEIKEASISSSDVFDIPDYLTTPLIKTCVLHASEPVPIIDIALLYDRVLASDREPPMAEFHVTGQRPLSLSSVRSVRVFVSGGESFAAPAGDIKNDAVKPGRVSRLSLIPPYVNGIVHYKGRIIPLIHLSRRMKLPKPGRAALMFVARLGKEDFGLLVDSDKGKLYTRNLKLKELPPLTRCRWMRSAAVRRKEILPLIDTGVLISARPEHEEEMPLPDRYKPASRFGEQYGREDVGVTEFLLLGVRHALPASEVVDSFRIKQYRRVPNVEPLVIGVAEHDGDLLPVLDLAMCFGRRSIVTPSWQMMLVKNGDFRALVITEEAFEPIQLTVPQQRGVPIVLPHSVVYGCYPAAAAVRLILNVEALAVHFDKALVKEFLAALSKEMEQAPSEIVPALLEPDVEAEAAEAAVSAAEREEEEEGVGVGEATAVAAAGVAAAGIAAASVPGESEEPIESEESDESEEFVESRESEELVESRESEEFVESEETVVAGAGGEKSEESQELVESKESEELEEPAYDAEPAAVPEPEPETMAPAEEVAVSLAQVGGTGEEEPDETIVRAGADALEPVGAEEMPTEADETVLQATGAVPESEEFVESQESKESEETVIAGAGGEAAGEESEAMEEAVQDTEIQEPAVAVPETGDETEVRESGEGVPEEGDETEAREPAFAVPEEGDETEVRESEETVVSAGVGMSVEDEEQPIEEEAIVREAEEIVRAEPATVAAYSSYADQPTMEEQHVTVPPDETEQGKGDNAEPEERKRGHWYAILIALLLFLLLFFGFFDRDTFKEAEKEEPVEPVVAERPATVPEGQPAELTILVPPDMPLPSNVYVVVKGDTLWHICRRFTGNPFDYPEVAAANNIINPDLIFPDQVIHLKHAEDYRKKDEEKE